MTYIEAMKKRDEARESIRASYSLAHEQESLDIMSGDFSESKKLHAQHKALKISLQPVFDKFGEIFDLTLGGLREDKSVSEFY